MREDCKIRILTTNYTASLGVIKLSKNQVTKDAKSVISIRALCEVCKKSNEFQISTKDLLPHIGGLYQVSTIHHCADNKDMIMNLVLDRNYSVRQSSVSPLLFRVPIIGKARRNFTYKRRLVLQSPTNIGQIGRRDRLIAVGRIP